MPLFLSQRATHLTERMDDSQCNRGELINTYRQFGLINSLISRWSYLYRSHIYPLCKQQENRATLLDIGFGGGDIPLKLSGWAEKDGIDLRITAIETDRRAFRYVHNLDTPENVSFLFAPPSELVAQNKSYDIVISNHLLHHLGQSECLKLLKEAQKLSNRKVLFNDLERSDLAYLLFNIFSRPVFQRSFITEDGLTSIRRSYTKTELAEVVPGNWEVRRLFPFRLLLSYSHD